MSLLICHTQRIKRLMTEKYYFLVPNKQLSKLSIRPTHISTIHVYRCQKGLKKGGCGVRGEGEGAGTGFIGKG